MDHIAPTPSSLRLTDQWTHWLCLSSYLLPLLQCSSAATVSPVCLAPSGKPCFLVTDSLTGHIVCHHTATHSCPFLLLLSRLHVVCLHLPHPHYPFSTQNKNRELFLVIEKLLIIGIILYYKPKIHMILNSAQQTYQFDSLSLSFFFKPATLSSFPSAKQSSNSERKTETDRKTERERERERDRERASKRAGKEIIEKFTKFQATKIEIC